MKISLKTGQCLPILPLGVAVALMWTSAACAVPGSVKSESRIMLQNPTPSPPSPIPPAPNPPPVPPAPRSALLQVTAGSDKDTYGAGDPIKLRIEIKNNDQNPVALTFPSGQSFDFEAFGDDPDKPVWQWSQGRMFTMMVRHVSLGAGESLVFNAVWKGAPEGKFRVVSRITANGGLPAPDFQVNVQ